MIGAGYVGLVSAACFSEFGWKVACVDKDSGRIEQLRQGHVPIYEPRLEELLERNLRMGRISFSTELAPSVGEADLVFLSVGTPMRRGDGHADLSFVFQAVEELAPHLSGYTVIATKSTVPVGTSREIERRLKLLRPDADFAVCSNPEFLREGSAIYDFTHPDRVLVGCDEERARGPDGSPLQAAHPAQCACHVRKPRIGRARQVHGERLPRHEDQLHQRGSRSLRGGRRRRAGSGDGDRCGRSHRQQVPASGAGLRRLLLSQGRGGADPHRARGTLAAVADRAGADGEFRAEDRHGRPHRARGGRLARRQDGGSARRRLQAGHRRRARGTEPHSHSDAPGEGREGEGLRSACAGERRAAAAWYRLVRERARGGRRGRRDRGGDGVERASRARSRRAQGAA